MECGHHSIILYISVITVVCDHKSKSIFKTSGGTRNLQKASRSEFNSNQISSQWENTIRNKITKAASWQVDRSISEECTPLEKHYRKKKTLLTFAKEKFPLYNYSKSQEQLPRRSYTATIGKLEILYVQHKKITFN